MEITEKIAVLIDAENISYKNAKQIVTAMENRGSILIKVIIANLASPQMASWAEVAKQYAMTATQQFSLVKGKNSSDMALVIQAMKILYEKPFITTFCIVSNDSDFTRLAQELKEHDKTVIGMGEKSKAKKEMVNAFSEFIYIENAEPSATPEKKPDKKPRTKTKTVIPYKIKECPIEEDKMKVLDKVIAELISANESDAAYYSAINTAMKKQFSDFVPQNYNLPNMSKLIDKALEFLPQYERVSQPMPNNPNGLILFVKSATKK